MAESKHTELISACRQVIDDYDRACKVKFDECKWEEFQGVEPIRAILDDAPQSPSWILDAAKEMRELAQSNIPGLSINDPEEMKEMELEIAAIIAKHAGGK